MDGEIGYVIPGSPAEKAGLKMGDKILEIDGHEVKRWQGMSEDSITWRIVRSEGETIPIKVRRGEQILVLDPKPEIPKTNIWNRKGLRQIGLLPADTPMVAKVEKGSPAANAGLRPNDLLAEVNGQRIYNPFSLADYAEEHPNEPLVLTVRRGDQQLKVPFTPLGAKIQAVFKDSPAEKAGLKPGDRVVAVDGQKFRFPNEVTEYIQKRGAEEFVVTVERDGEGKEMKVRAQTPVGESVPRIGVEWDVSDTGGILLDRFGKFGVVYPGPIEQMRGGFMAIVNTLDAIISKKSDVKLQHMGGPVMMMRIYYVMFESPEGWRMALWFSVVLNVNLAVLNLLPIPVLDGGHITLALVEAARRRPVNVRFLEVRSDSVRGVDHRLHALYRVFRCAGSAVVRRETGSDEIPRSAGG